MPVCCALQIALVVLLRSWNIFPSAVLGHSSGESAAAFAAGTLDMRSALAVQYYRGLMTAAVINESDVKGAMLAAGLNPEEAQKQISNITSGKVIIGCYNSPSNITLSGDEAGIIEVEESLKAAGVFARRLKVQNAFHSHHMEKDAAEYRQLLESSLSTEGRPMDIPLASSVTGTWLTKSTDFGPDHWVDYMLLPVQFTKASTRLLTETIDGDGPRSGQKPVNIILEIGPHSALSSPLRQTMKTLNVVDVAYTSVLKRGENALVSARDAMGFLWSRGYPVDLIAISQGNHHDSAFINLPSYPWNHVASLAIHHPSEFAFRHRRYPKDGLIGTHQSTSNPSAPSWQRACSINGKSWPMEFIVDDVALSPHAMFIGMAVAAMRQLTSNLSRLGAHDLICLEKVLFNSTAALPSRPTTILLRTSLHEMQKSGEKDANCVRNFQIHCIQDPNEWTLLCEGQIALQTASTSWHVTKELNGVVDSFHTNGVPIRLGAFSGVVIDSGGANLGLPQLNVARANMSPDALSISLQGQLLGFSENPEGNTIAAYQKLRSAFQALDIARQAHLEGVAKQALVSIEQVTIYPNLADDAPIFYVANVKENRDEGTCSVIWGSTGDANGTISALMRDINIQGIKFDCESSYIRRVHASSLFPCLINASNGAMNGIPRHRLGSQEKSILLDLNVLCRGFFCRTLQALRADPPRRLLGHFSSYVQFMKSIESTSAAEWERLSVEEAAALKARVYSSSVNGQLVCTVGEQLVPLIRGEVDPLEVMMKDRLLHRYYEEGLRWTRSYEQLQALIKMLSLEHPRMNILEIGAGTGGATTSVLQALEIGEQSVDDIRCESYTYTDISAGFFAKAKEKFKRYNHAMTFKKLNIEKDLRSQMFEDRKYDLIVASQCLHATSNMRATMANVRKLLNPGGRLVMVETTKDSLDIQLFASCFRGWWLSMRPFHASLDGKTVLTRTK